MEDGSQAHQLVGLLTPHPSSLHSQGQVPGKSAVEFAQCSLALPGAGLTEEGTVRSGNVDVHVYGKELGTVPGAVFSKG